MAFNNQESPPKALLVEDIEIDRIILLAMLRRFHFETTVANNGKEAVDIFLEGKTFDIVLSDKDMPVMTGPESIVKIRAMGATDVKIVGVSADLHSEEAFMSAGADVFVPKPMTLEVLEPMLQEVISKKKQEGLASSMGSDM